MNRRSGAFSESFADDQAMVKAVFAGQIRKDLQSMRELAKTLIDKSYQVQYSELLIKVADDLELALNDSLTSYHEARQQWQQQTLNAAAVIEGSAKVLEGGELLTQAKMLLGAPEAEPIKPLFTKAADVDLSAFGFDTAPEQAAMAV